MSWLQNFDISPSDFPPEQFHIASNMYSNEMEFLQELYNTIVQSIMNKSSQLSEQEQITFANTLATKICFLSLLFNFISYGSCEDTKELKPHATNTIDCS